MLQFICQLRNFFINGLGSADRQDPMWTGKRLLYGLPDFAGANQCGAVQTRVFIFDELLGSANSKTGKLFQCPVDLLMSSTQFFVYCALRLSSLCETQFFNCPPILFAMFVELSLCMCLPMNTYLDMRFTMYF